ncbi:uncharacterized protein I303_101903 [Kwoniella dejecticola CBS 10117]|uniref:Guanyl nucleotide binding protein n=1 Tax=Kwoniella dejecticola CBS 10117 TaxID=1296121 RepID=A0A1A6ACG3_9TREE|nr:uncharacterized protein I303_01961 [Kwoniella dejecticola CBS 10117]OBR87749.1 hypothetical protein I303_01961 [Kwoniella dejecticola CBS 10117]
MADTTDASEAAAQQWSSAPAYDLKAKPTAVATLDAKELDSEVGGNFWRSARWCIDGSATLSTTEDRVLRIHTLNAESNFQTKAFEQPDAIHSTAWYPSASTATPETLCFVASIRDTPIRLIDGNDGRIRASYPIVDHRERFVAPHSLAFNPTATKLYCGHENAIEVFDIASPGYDQGERLKLVYAKKEKGGQRGIISALSFCPDYSGTYAAGSFSGNGSVALYSEDTGSTPLAHVEGLVGGGVTQIGWHPLNPTTMFISSRRSRAIQIYDTRDWTSPLSSFPRDASTNQRIAFDVDPWGRWLASGDEHGAIKIWDLATMDTQPIFEEQLHQDAVGSVQLHPFQPLLLTCSGSRRHLQDGLSYEEDQSSSDESADGDTDETSSSEDEDQTYSRQSTTRPASRDTSLRIWSMRPEGNAQDPSTDGAEA